MRIRQVKPAFWTDKVTARLSRSARLTYIGLWMLCDDAGWIEAFDAEQAAAELFPWEPVGRRTREVAHDIDVLSEAGRVVISEDCGCLHVPHLAEHQRIAGHQTFAARDAHRRHQVATASDIPLPVATERRGIGTERRGTERRVEGAHARDEKSNDGEATDFRRRVGPFAVAR